MISPKDGPPVHKDGPPVRSEDSEREPGTDSTLSEQAREPAIRFDLFTLFPAMLAGPLDASILRRAQDRGLIDVRTHDLRDWATDRHRTADDTPYGGGAGMVMLAAPIVAAVEQTLGDDLPATHVAFLSAGGGRFTQAVARELAAHRRLALVCGHYEGVDERAVLALDAAELSIGDYVLTGGELAALVVVDAVARLVPGVIDAASVAEESHADGLVEYPHYTRPAVFRGMAVPEVLLSGHHARIAAWRRDQAVLRTAQRRPDLLAAADLTAAERERAAAAAATDTPADTPAPASPSTRDHAAASPPVQADPSSLPAEETP